MKDQVLKNIDELAAEHVKILEDICNIESPTNHKAGVDAVGEYFIRYANERGWKVEVFEQERAGNVVTITMNPEVDAAPIAFSGHMDTVHELGSFGYPPVRVEGDKIYGPGVEDCKGGIVVGFLAMDALWKAGYKARPVVMYLQSDEEGGGKYSGDATINHICEVAKAQETVAFFNLEGGNNNNVCIGRKGIVSFEFTVDGVEAHSAGCATNGSSAILEAAYKIIELDKFKDPKGLTCCCTTINGGTKHNIVPGQCKFVANVRFAKMSELDEFIAAAEKICADIKVPGCKCTMVLPRLRPAMELCDRNIDLVAKLNKIWTDNGMSELPGVTSAGGSDAANVSAAGVPAVDNMGIIGGWIHTPKEFAILSSIPVKAKRLALATLYL